MVTAPLLSSFRNTTGVTSPASAKKTSKTRTRTRTTTKWTTAPRALAKQQHNVFQLSEASATNETTVIKQSSKRDFDYYHNLRLLESARALSPQVTRVSVSDDDDGDLAAPTVHDLRHLVMFVPLDIGPGQSQWINSAGTAILALYHFNNGIDSIVPDIKYHTAMICPDLRFTLELMDTKYSPIFSSAKLVELVQRETQADSVRMPFPTGLVGAVRSAVSGPMSTLSGIYQLPQLSYASTATGLDNKGQYPLFGRLVPSASADAHAAVEYLVQRLGVTHFGVIHLQDEYGATYANAVQAAAAARGVTVERSSFEFSATPEAITEALQQHAANDFRYFFGIFLRPHFEIVMKAAAELGLTGPGRFWIFSDGLDSLVEARYPLGAAPIAGTHGAALITTANPSVLDGYGTFLSEWRAMAQDETFLKYFFDLLPEGLNAPKSWDEIEMVEPSVYAFFSYESTMAMALSACVASSTDPFFSAEDLFSTFLQLSFSGPYGRAEVDPETGTREGMSVPFTISNLVSNGPDANGTVSFRTVVTDVFMLNPEDAKSTTPEWNRLRDYTYSDGTHTPPDILPPLEENKNQITTGILVCGFLLCLVTVAVSVGCASWTLAHRNTLVVRASQPLFLVLICVGTMIMGLSIIPLSFEEPLPERLLDFGCNLSPWLLSVGFVTSFSALLTKTMRINKVESM